MNKIKSMVKGKIVSKIQPTDETQDNYFFPSQFGVLQETSIGVITRACLPILRCDVSELQFEECSVRENYVKDFSI